MNHLTSKRVKYLRELGMSLREIASIVELSTARVHQILNPKTKRVYKSYQKKYYPSVNDVPIDVHSVLHLRGENKSIRVIAYLLGIPKTRVWRIINKHKGVDKALDSLSRRM